MVRSADPSTGEIRPNAVAGSASSLAVRPAKCTSPAKIRVMPDPAATAPGAGARAGRAALPPHPAGPRSFADTAADGVAGPGMPGAGATGRQAASAATMTSVRLTSSALAGIGPG